MLECHRFTSLKPGLNLAKYRLAMHSVTSKKLAKISFLIESASAIELDAVGPLVSPCVFQLKTQMPSVWHSWDSRQDFYIAGSLFLPWVMLITCDIDTAFYRVAPLESFENCLVGYIQTSCKSAGEGDLLSWSSLSGIQCSSGIFWASLIQYTKCIKLS